MTKSGIKRIADKFQGVAEQDGFETLYLTLRATYGDRNVVDAVMKELERRLVRNKADGK